MPNATMQSKAAFIGTRSLLHAKPEDASCRQRYEHQRQQAKLEPPALGLSLMSALGEKLPRPVKEWHPGPRALCLICHAESAIGAASTSRWENPHLPADILWDG